MIRTVAFVVAGVLGCLPFSLIGATTDGEKAGETVGPATPAILCADQADNRIRLIDPASPNERKPTLWSYPTEDAKPLMYKPTDAKRVEFSGQTHVLAAYHGRVRLIRFSDHKLVKDFASYSSCHSAELLPDGTIATASSNHGKLRLHFSADTYDDCELPYGHGVAWDKSRHCLWALGDLLYRYRYADRKLTLEEKYKLPKSPTGHDLFPLRNEAKLLVSNNHALFLFDIENETFELISDLTGIKSASQHQDSTIWASEPKKDLINQHPWQSDSILRVRPMNPVTRHVNQGARFYKARWW